MPEHKHFPFLLAKLECRKTTRGIDSCWTHPINLLEGDVNGRRHITMTGGDTCEGDREHRREYTSKGTPIALAKRIGFLFTTKSFITTCMSPSCPVSCDRNGGCGHPLCTSEIVSNWAELSRCLATIARCTVPSRVRNPILNSLPKGVVNFSVPPLIKATVCVCVCSALRHRSLSQTLVLEIPMCDR